MTLPEKIGRYEIRAELGRGGMATVYQAFDPRFKRDVALKALPREFNHDPMFRARFQREAETIAALEHPAIVPVYDFGEEDGLPYLVMRLMTGGSLSERIADGPLPVQEVSRVLERIGGALDRAHDLGIVHRDLKPGNILFDQYGDAFLADFGIARLAASNATLTGSGLVGTPAYMSPEQIQGSELDGRSDVYALGIIVFEMLTGSRPYHAETPAMVLVKQMTEPTPRILDVNPDLPPGCELVISKAMAKDIDERYERASEVSATLASAVAGEAMPVPSRELTQLNVPEKTAVPDAEPTMVEEPEPPPAEAALEPVSIPETVVAPPGSGLPKWAWGLIGLAVLVAVISAVLVAGELFFGDDDGTVVLSAETEPLSAADMLDETEDDAPAAESEDAFSEASDSLPVDGFVAQTRLGRGTVDAVAPNPAGTVVAVGGSVGIWLYEADTLETIALLEGHQDVVWDLSWSPDGERLASASWDETIRIWDVAAAETIATLHGEDEYTNVAWSPDGAFIAATTWYPGIELWDVAGRRQVAFWEGHEDTITDLAWRPGGSLLAAADSAAQVLIWDAAAEKVLRVLEGVHEGDVWCAEWSPDGTHLATCGGDDASIVVWEGDTGQPLQVLQGHEYGVYDLTWLPGGEFVVSVGDDGTVRSWHALEGWQDELIAEYWQALVAISWMPDTNRLILASSGGTLLSATEEDEEMVVLTEHTDALWQVLWSPDGTAVAAAGSDAVIRAWDAASGTQLGILEEHFYGVTAIAWSPDSRLLASTAEDGWTYVWNLEEGWIETEWLHEAYAASSLSWHPFEPWLAMGDYGGDVWIWDIADDALVVTWTAHVDSAIWQLAWDPDGENLVTVGEDDLVHVWDLEEPEEEPDFISLAGHEDDVIGVAWSPDGAFLATASFDQTVRVWDVDGEEEIATLAGHRELATAVAWSPDGAWLASGGWDYRVRIWDTFNWRETIELAGHNHAVTSLDWSPDGSRLASSSEDGTIIIWGHE